MKTPRPETIAALRKMFPKGTFVMLIHMDDPQAPPAGTLGQVDHVDDMGQIFCNWASGGSLRVTWPEDVAVVLEPEHWDIIRDAYSNYTLSWLADQKYGAMDFLEMVDEYRDEKAAEGFVEYHHRIDVDFCEYIRTSCCPELVYSFSEFIEKLFLNPTHFGRYLNADGYKILIQKLLPNTSNSIVEVEEKAIEYPYIYAWGKMLGSYQTYIDNQVALAKRHGAPQNTTYIRQDGTWSTIEDVMPEDTRDILHGYVRELTGVE